MNESKSMLSKYWISTHVSQRPIPHPFRQSCLICNVWFSWKGALMTNADSTPQLMLLLWVFICAWAFWARNVKGLSLIPVLKPLAKCIWSSRCNSKEQTLTMRVFMKYYIYSLFSFSFTHSRAVLFKVKVICWQNIKSNQN